MFGFSFSVPVILGVFLLLIILSGIKMLMEYDRGVIFRLGRMVGVKGPGLVYIVPFIDKMMKVDLRTITMDVPPQDVISKDNVTIKVNAVVYLRVMNPDKAIVNVENYIYATSQLAQTTLRSVLGEVELDELLSQREVINAKLQAHLDRDTDPWGVKVSKVEVKHIDLPKEMQRAMAKQAEAERERRAKIIAAEGEFQASEKIAQAAKVMSVDSTALQLRYLQTLVEIAQENNSTTIFPIPIDFLKPFMKKD
ncbi:MAG: slipin family protein [Deltaproteobacteria bacterium]|nr:slipin family protein [Deltaproteobacteria bacterium]